MWGWCTEIIPRLAAVPPQQPRGKRGTREDTPHPAGKSQRYKRAPGANSKAEPSGGVRLLCPQTPAGSPVRAVCPLGLMWE